MFLWGSSSLFPRCIYFDTLGPGAGPQKKKTSPGMDWTRCTFYVRRTGDVSGKTEGKQNKIRIQKGMKKWETCNVICFSSWRFFTTQCWRVFLLSLPIYLSLYSLSIISIYSPFLTRIPGSRIRIRIRILYTIYDNQLRKKVLFNLLLSFNHRVC